MLDCQEAAEELKETLSELQKQRFDNVVTQYDGILSLMEHEKNMLEGYIDQSESQAWLVSGEYYRALASYEREHLAELKEEESALLKTYNDVMASGTIDETSEEWVSLCSSINEVTEAIQESETQLLEYNQTLQQLSWEVFDLLQDRISNITDEAEFLIDLMSSNDLYDDKGQFTDEGWATAGLYGVNYNVAMAQADKYAEEIKKIQKELESDPFDTDLQDRYYELVEAQQDAIQSAQDYKESIRDLVEDGIEAELDSLDELISKYTDALDSQKDLYDYQKDIAEQTAEIASLQKQLSAYSSGNDNSEENRKRISELKISLNEAEQELEETEYDRMIEDAESLLDDFRLEYETVLNQRLDNLELLITEMADSINANASSIGDTLLTKADEVGYSLSESMSTIWQTSDFADASGTVKNVITTYGDNFTTAWTTTNAALGNISTDIETMIGQLNKIAGTNVKSAQQTAAAKAAEEARKAAAAEAAKNQSSNASSAQSKSVSVGGTINAGNATIYATSTGGGGGKQYFGSDPIYTVLSERNGYVLVRHHSLSSGYTGWFKKSDVSAYASGKKNILDDEFAWTQENGQEFIVRPSDGAILTPLAQGDSVLNAAASSNLWDMANNPVDFIKDNLGIGNVDTVVGSGAQTSVVQNFDQIVFSMPQVKNYDQMLAQMKKDKNFQNLIDSMGVDQLAGKSSLRKGKSIR